LIVALQTKPYWLAGFLVISSLEITIHGVKNECLGRLGLTRRARYGVRKLAEKRVIESLVEDERQRAYTVSDGIRHLWRGRIWVAAAAALGLTLGMLFVLYTAVSKPSVTTYRSAIALTMKGAKPGEYPNGSPFGPSDLRSPAVLDVVYKNLNLDNFKLGRVDFANAVNVEAFSPSIDGITARYQARARAKNITPEELRAIEDVYRTELAAAQSEGLQVLFTVDGKFGIPDEIGRQVVAAIPAVWSQVFIDSLGVISYPVARSAADLIDQRLVETLDYPLVFDYIESSELELEKRLLAISQLPNSTNVAVQDSTQTLFDLQRRTVNARAFSIEKIMRPIVDKGLSRTQSLTVLAYENRAQVIEIDEKSDIQKSQSISSLIRERNATDMPLGNGAAGSAGAQGAAGSGSGNFSALGDGVVDRIVALSISSAGAQFREQLLNEKMGVENSITEKIRERKLIERRLAGIRSQGTVGELPDHAALVAAFESASASTIKELNDVWQRANEILSIVSRERLNLDKQLYASLPSGGAQTSTPFYRSVYLWAVFVSLIALFALAGLAAYLLFSIVKTPGRFLRSSAAA
jgi:hypothetical protein